MVRMALHSPSGTNWAEDRTIRKRTSRTFIAKVARIWVWWRAIRRSRFPLFAKGTATAGVVRGRALGRERRCPTPGACECRGAKPPRLPCKACAIKPPWVHSAINSTKGELCGRSRTARTSRTTIKKHPALNGRTFSARAAAMEYRARWLRELVIAGESGNYNLAARAADPCCALYEQASGKEVGAVYMPGPQTGSPHV